MNVYKQLKKDFLTKEVIEELDQSNVIGIITDNFILLKAKTSNSDIDSIVQKYICEMTKEISIYQANKERYNKII